MGTLGGDQIVEPVDVTGHAVGRVLHDGAGVDIEIDGRTTGLGEALDQQRPSAFEHGQPSLRRQVAGESQTKPETPGVVDGAAIGQELGEEDSAAIGDPVNLLAPA
jgi:hypothetical protein